MNKTHDMFEGFFDNTLTNHREYWCEGRKGRHGHKSGISPDSIHKEFRAPWLTYPDVPRAYQASQLQAHPERRQP